MTHGGTRPGAGRPSKAITRRAMVNLDADTAAKLLELEQMRRASASDVIRECIRLAHALALDDLIP